MKSLIDNVKSHTPRQIPGYTYIKTQNVYIPFMKVTVECLTRRISELNLFFESIMRLVALSVCDISEIADILGVSHSIVKEAVIDMVAIDYIYTSETKLGLTTKGNKALMTKQRVDIKKIYLKDVFIDTITGVVHDADAISVTKPRAQDVLLESTIQIDTNYLDSHFPDINQVYQTQLRNNSVFGDNAITSELYKIIGISYSEMQYVENRINIFQSDTSAELRYEFSMDDKDLYKGEFYNQLKDSYRPCQEYFFEKNRDLVRNITLNPPSTDCLLLRQSEEVRKLIFTENVPSDTLINAFTTARYSLNDKEYMSYLYHHRALRYKKLIICSDHLTTLLSHSFCSQLNVLAESIPVYLVYQKNEYNIDKSLAHFFKDKGKFLCFKPRTDIKENTICFDSQLVMLLQEHVASAFERDISFMRITCIFDKSRNIEYINKLIRMHHLDEVELSVEYN